jgi:AraC family transcriptional regulator, arabinose operon regulatory protein
MLRTSQCPGGTGQGLDLGGDPGGWIVGAMDVDLQPTRQRMVVLPPADRAAGLADPWTGQMLATDVGVYPRALGHMRTRDQGAAELLLMVCLAGRGTVTLGGREQAVLPGAVVVLPAQQAHAYGADHRDPWTLWWLHLTGTQVDLLPQAGWLVSGVHAHPEPRAVVTAIARVLAALERGTDAGRRAAATTAAWSVLALLHQATVPAEDPLVAATIANFHAQLARPVAVAGLARQAGLSTAHFAARFKAATGTGPIDFLLRLRMERAAWLLTNSSQSIEAIALQVGYADPAYFSRRFTRHHGCAPRDYRGR